MRRFLVLKRFLFLFPGESGRRAKGNYHVIWLPVKNLICSVHMLSSSSISSTDPTLAVKGLTADLGVYSLNNPKQNVPLPHYKLCFYISLLKLLLRFLINNKKKQCFFSLDLLMVTSRINQPGSWGHESHDVQCSTMSEPYRPVIFRLHLYVTHSAR